MAGFHVFSLRDLDKSGKGFSFSLDLPILVVLHEHDAMHGGTAPFASTLGEFPPVNFEFEIIR